MNLHMTIQHYINLVPELGHIVHDMFTDWVPRVPRRRLEKQVKNNEETISERLVQATKREKKKEQTNDKKNNQLKNPREMKRKNKAKTATGWMERRNLSKQIKRFWILSLHPYFFFLSHSLLYLKILLIRSWTGYFYNIYIYIYIYISSSYRAGSTDIPDLLLPLLPNVHRPR